MESFADANTDYEDKKSIPSPSTYRISSYYDDNQYHRFPSQFVDDNDEDSDYYQVGFVPNYKRYRTILITVGLLLIFQFQGPLIRIFRKIFPQWHEIETWRETEYRSESFLGIVKGFILDSIVAIYDYIWIGWYTVMELRRNIILGLYSILPWFLKQDHNIVFNYDAYLADRQPHDRIRIVGDRRENHFIPALEGDQTIANRDKSEHNNRRFCQTFVELEPAFTCESDFPEDWVVYDPVLGVVSKAVADKYKSDLHIMNGVANAEARQHGDVVSKENDTVASERNAEVKTAVATGSFATNDDDYDLCSKSDQVAKVECLRSVLAT